MLRPSRAVVVLAAATGLVWPAPAAAQRAPTPAIRMFPITAKDAWERVLKHLPERGLPSDKIDRNNQVLLTEWRKVGAKGVEWLPPPAVPQPYVATRFRFLVYVSPFIEPARVHIGSLIEAASTQGPKTWASAYNAPNLNVALMGEVGAALGVEGQPVPTHASQRRELASSMIGGAANECLRQGPRVEGAKITTPKKIPLSQFDVIYPEKAKNSRSQGAVEVEFTILEDGGVVDVHLLGTPPPFGLASAAMGAASLLLYSPPNADGCPIPAKMTYTVNFVLR